MKGQVSFFPRFALLGAAIKPADTFRVERDVDIRAEQFLKPFLEFFAFWSCARLTLNEVNLAALAHEFLHKLQEVLLPLD